MLVDHEGGQGDHPSGRRGPDRLEVAAELSCDWHMVSDAVVTYGEALLGADRKRLNQTSAIGLDETSFVKVGPMADVANYQIIDILPTRKCVDVGATSGLPEGVASPAPPVRRHGAPVTRSHDPWAPAAPCGGGGARLRFH